MGIPVDTFLQEEASSSIVQDLVLINERLVVLTNASIFALDSNTGDLLWSNPFDNQLSIFGSNLLAKEQGIFLEAPSGTVTRLNADDGIIQWQTSVEEESSMGLSTRQLVFDNGKIYYPLPGPNESGIWVLDANTGSIKNMIDVSNIDGVNIYFDFLGRIEVQDNYLVKQTAINTYGIKLP